LGKSFGDICRASRQFGGKIIPVNATETFPLFVLFVCLFFLLAVLICDNTLIQVVKLKKIKKQQKKKILTFAES